MGLANDTKMGLEFRIETYDVERAGLFALIEKLPEFLRMDASGGYHLAHDGENVGVTVSRHSDMVYVVQHVACSETDAILGLVVRTILSMNDSVVIHGGY
ncbi:MAG: hypothetical protein AAGG44_03505 [Planctomycetota bacterium]